MIIKIKKNLLKNVLIKVEIIIYFSYFKFDIKKVYHPINTTIQTVS